MNELIAELASKGIVVIHIDYNGSGDEGFFEEANAFNEAGDEIVLKYEVSQRLENWGYDVLEDYFAGWEINEGSSGHIQIDIEDGAAKVTIDHNENIVTTQNEKKEFSL